MINQIRQELQSLVDEEYAKFNQKLCPDTNKKMLGIRVPRASKIGAKNYKRIRLERIFKASRR